MTQTLRREIRIKILEHLEKMYQDNPPSNDATEYNKAQAELLADIVLSVSGIAKQTDETKGRYTTKSDLEAVSLEAAIFGGGALNSAILEDAKAERSAVDAFESAWGITRPWDWWQVKKEWNELRQTITDIYRQDARAFTKYVAWYDDQGKFGQGKSAAQIQRDPTCFYTAWDMFGRSEKSEPKSNEPRKLEQEDESQYVYVPHKRPNIGGQK